MSMSVRSIAPVGVALFLASTLMIAQVITGQITGRITDSSGAVVPDVEVIVTQTATGVTRTVQTNGEGYYTATLLPPGLYEIQAKKSGFRLSRISNIDVRVNQINRIDVALELGTPTETVNVAATAVNLETETGSLSTDVGRKSLDNLPLNTRDAYRLAFLSPGGADAGLWRRLCGHGANPD